MFEKVGNGNTREQNKQKLKTNKQTKKPPCNYVSLLALDPPRINQDSIFVSIKFKATDPATFCN